MGKPTGFMEYARKNDGAKAPLERIKDFAEFRLFLSEEERGNQAARCMDCGVPFCQAGMELPSGATGCPLNSLIPEWNDLLFQGKTRHALSRLLKRNNFPEFTGRVCPALCEAACVCGINGSPVSCHENELAIIETAWQNGWMKPRVPAVRSGRRVAVIGSGPAGLAAADRLNKRGHSVDIFERADRPGGLLMYGIPNMKLDKSVVERRIRLMEEEGVIFRTGCEAGTDVEGGTLLRDYDAVLLCCGSSRPRDIEVKNRDAKGVWFAVDFLTAVTKSLLDPAEGKALPEFSGKNAVVVGGGDTGGDCVATLIRLGCGSVTQLEMTERPPVKRARENGWPYWPKTLKTDYGQEEAAAVFGSDPRRYQTTVKELIKDEQGTLRAAVTVSLERGGESGQPVPVSGSEEEIPCDILLIAAGFLGAEEKTAAAFGAELSERGRVETKEGSFAASVPKLFAAGDARRGPSLVVHAINEGRRAAAEIDGFLMGYSGLS
ncbi:MAG: glutamate synthase subunit beta [Bacillota bacterium]